jgi:hypothetical protein
MPCVSETIQSLEHPDLSKWARFRTLTPDRPAQPWTEAQPLFRA